jgi:hypothetical protein
MTHDDARRYHAVKNENPFVEQQTLAFQPTLAWRDRRIRRVGESDIRRIEQYLLSALRGERRNLIPQTGYD